MTAPINVECVADVWQSPFGSFTVSISSGRCVAVPPIPEPNWSANQSDDLTESHRFIRDVITELVGIDWLTKISTGKRSHVLHSMWKRASDAVDQGGTMSYDLRSPVYRASISALLDARDIRATLNLTQDLSLGGSEAPLFWNTILSRARAAKDTQYANLQCELAFMSWCISKGYAVTPIVPASMPDFIVSFGADQTKYLVECKQPVSGSINALKKALSKANVQFRNAGSLPGLLVLDLRLSGGINDYVRGQTPEHALFAKGEVERLLHGSFSSVSAVVFVWDELLVRRKRGDVLAYTIVLLRRTLRLLNPNSRYPIDAQCFFFEYGSTLVFEIHSGIPLPRRLSLVPPKGSKSLKYTGRGLGQPIGPYNYGSMRASKFKV